MSSFVDLCIVLVVMMVVAIIGGLIPIKLGDKLPGFNYFSYFGMGILIATALVIIIPEGVKTLYEATSPDGPEAWSIGLPLIFGFVIMYLQDNIPMLLEAWNLKSKINYTEVDGLAPGFSIAHGFKSILQSALTLGLLLHGIIDGISLGLSYALSESHIGLIMFVVIVVHKLPTSFSFTSILLKEGFSPQIAQFHLFLFALTTPLAAITTYLIIKVGAHDSQFVIALLFLFSAGTFLYVIHHVMSNVGHSKSDDLHNSTNTLEQSSALEFLATLGGACLPILVSFLGGD
ncbi:ZIP family metal transporter [Kocuria palustris]|nr:ZIP family metal transporter [Kocuria palustris]